MKIGMRHLHLFILLFAVSSLLFHPPSDFEAFAATSDGSVDSTVEINDETASLGLFNGDNFGTAVANIGDLDGDGVNDLVVGAYHDNAGGGAGTNRGAVHIIFMNTDGTVKSNVEINKTTANGPSALLKNDNFGRSVANIGDLDGDGVNDLAVGAFEDDGGGTNRGATYIIFMNTDGSVDSTKEISNSTANGPNLNNHDHFGASVANIGDLDGDGVNDLAVGAHLGNTIHIIFMNTDGTVKSIKEINSSTTNGPELAGGDRFGGSVANIGDLDGDGVNDLVVGAFRDHNAAEGTGDGDDRGAVHIIFMNTDGTVKSTKEISNSTANGPNLADNDQFGVSVANIGDLDGDGVNDLAVGAHLDDAGTGDNLGAVHIIFMNTDGTVKSIKEINDTTTNVPNLADNDQFGASVANIGDLDGNDVIDLAVGVWFDDTGTGNNLGAVHILFLHETTKPTVTITPSSGDCGDTVDSTTLSYTVTFSESTSNFVVGDITVTGTANSSSPEASNFAGSGTTYTFDVIKGSSDGTVIVSVAAGVATDAAGNDNTASDSCTFTINIPVTTTSTAASTGGTCSRYVILGNCGTIAINNDVYSIIRTWTDVPTTEVLVGEPVTVTLSTTNNPTYTKIHFASIYTEIFNSPTNYEQSTHVDYSVMNSKVTYVSQSQLFQVAGATHRVTEDPNTRNLDRFEVVFTMIFAKPMDTSHIVVEIENKFGIPETLYLTSALRVNENLQQALTLEEKSKFELEYEPVIDKITCGEGTVLKNNTCVPELIMDTEVKVTCGEGTVLKDNLCVPKEWSFLDFFQQLMKLFG